MKSSSLEEDRIEDNIVKDGFRFNLFRLKKDDATIKDVRYLLRLGNEIDDTTNKDTRNLFRLKKQNEAIKDIIIRDIRNFFEHEEDCYKPVRVGSFWSRNYIEYESNGDRNKTLSVEEYLNKICPYLKDIINDLKKPNTWKIQLTTAVNIISSKDNDEVCVMHSRSVNIEIMTNDK